MSTPCLIAHNTGSGYQAITCRFRGYNHHNGVGPTLRHHYSKAEQVYELIQNGHLLVLFHQRPVPLPNCQKGQSQEQPPFTLNQRSELFECAWENKAHYIYLYEADQWKTFCW